MYVAGGVNPKRVEDLITRLRKVRAAVGDELLIRIAKEQPSPSQAFAHARAATGNHGQAVLCQSIAQLKRDFPDAFKEVFGE